MKSLLSILCSKKVKYSFILIFLFFLYISIHAFSYASYVSEDIANSVFFFFFIANSDSTEDQNLKYKVRDKVISYMNEINTASNKQDVIELAKKHIDDFQAIAEQTIQEEGYDYSVSVEIGNFYFPTKNYGDISLPAGDYDALRINIGEAKGQNWWCVMFPPLCFVNVTSGVVPEDSKDMMKQELSDESYHIISDTNSSEVKFKFKLIEWLQNVNILTANK